MVLKVQITRACLKSALADFEIGTYLDISERRQEGNNEQETGVYMRINEDSESIIARYSLDGKTQYCPAQ